MFDKLAIIERIVCYQRSAFYELYLQFHVFLKTFLHLAQVALLAVRYFLMLLSNWYSRQNSKMIFFSIYRKFELILKLNLQAHFSTIV